MIRMTLFLCACVYGTLLIGGSGDAPLRSGLQAEPAKADAAPVFVRVPVKSPAPQAHRVAVDTNLPVMTASVTAGNLNLRDGASLSAPVLDRLSRNQEVGIIRQKGDWTLVRTEGGDLEGWVSSSYLTAIPLQMAGN
ncbi:SH3 domain-containing protein [Falsirhodobacter sp. alg1]|uniref:SH3 domain-containing protein n=1 Tax=Falsirhodobacter sp. alg1 TaxID=1472418 RepID=UPI0005EE5E4E|nr:SH3 domain-containing protein [Falsirhodobacter sp. alg1]